MSLRDQNNVYDALAKAKEMRGDLDAQAFLLKLLLGLGIDIGQLASEVSGDDKWRQNTIIAGMYCGRTFNKPWVYKNAHVKNLAKFKDTLGDMMGLLLAISAVISEIEQEPYDIIKAVRTKLLKGDEESVQ
jgi:hypothetical protein